MNSDAPGQLLGYTIQFPRALLHLLRAGPGDVVGVEVLGDVSTKRFDGTAISEEDKSSIRGNPVTDKSENLWKTFYNWARSIEQGDLEVARTSFILFANKSGRRGLVDDFHEVKDITSAEVVIGRVRAQLEPLAKEHPIWSYYDYLINHNSHLFGEILVRFELEVDEGALSDQIARTLQTMHVPERQIGFLIESVSGWLVGTLLERIAGGNSGLVSWDEFNQKFITLFSRARSRELIDVSVNQPPKGTEIQAHLESQPTYLEQLDIIGLTEDRKIEAITDYLRANVNRHNWIENGILDEQCAVDFERKLSRFWANERRGFELTRTELSSIHRGELLYLACMSRQETLRDMVPPECTIPGTYHALADEPVLGWHADWKAHFSDSEEE
ncbi:MAG: hypothetical protein DRR06_00625 [Gammaproteobacteria bacterium]|nr:MAG: hypothetical protein DRR06_00625 [Gammaproteobacteria bacterium]RLA52633.1 MAG: hypothetical protein DRR42_07050 [Gammaproteobacteria bacterium]